jgi:hypothetical protein
VFTILQILTVILVAVTMALALAHALELPGKMRLTQETYYTTQPIYYPGFTIGGISEPISILLTATLLFLMPSGSIRFWLTLVALLGLLGMQAISWLFIHPVNQFWLENKKLSSAGSSFFSFGVKQKGARPTNWTELRNRWEYSHVVRAAFALVCLTALVITITLNHPNVMIAIMQK